MKLCGLRTRVMAAHRPSADRGMKGLCYQEFAFLHRCSHNFLHVDSKSSTSFKNDVIVCVVRIRKENFQCVSYVAKLFPNALKGLLIKSVTKFRQDFTALFFPLI